MSLVALGKLRKEDHHEIGGSLVDQHILGNLSLYSKSLSPK